MIVRGLRTFRCIVFHASFALACTTAWANADTPLPTIPLDPQASSAKATDYSATPDMPRMRSDTFNTPQDDGRPGEYYFYLGALADRRGDYEHAIAMYKVSASWAYKPAEYNLGVLYLNGHGSDVDLPRAMAWFALAAERGEKRYTRAKALTYAHLTTQQWEQANEIWRELLPRYGDATALVRAKTRWREVRYAATGSRVGSSATHLINGGAVGMADHHAPPNYDVFSGGHESTTPGEITGPHQTDGSIAYQQLRQSDDPYDPRFSADLTTGTVTVGALSPVR